MRVIIDIANRGLLEVTQRGETACWAYQSTAVDRIRFTACADIHITIDVGKDVAEIQTVRQLRIDCRSENACRGIGCEAARINQGRVAWLWEFSANQRAKGKEAGCAAICNRAQTIVGCSYVRRINDPAHTVANIPRCTRFVFDVKVIV